MTDVEHPGLNSLITIRVPGATDRALKDSNYPNDEPVRWRRYRENRELRNAGAGYVAVVALPRKDWSDIRDYLRSRVGALLDMTSANSDGLDQSDRTELRAGRTTIARINETIGPED